MKKFLREITKTINDWGYNLSLLCLWISILNWIIYYLSMSHKFSLPEILQNKAYYLIWFGVELFIGFIILLTSKIPFKDPRRLFAVMAIVSSALLALWVVGNRF